MRRRMLHPELLTRFRLRESAGGPWDAIPRDPPPFGVDVERGADVATVRPRGDLDLVTATRLQAALDRIERARRIVLDLSRVSFLDSAGVHLLVDLQRRAQRERFDLSIVPPPAPADLALELCGLYDALPFAPRAAPIGP